MYRWSEWIEKNERKEKETGPSFRIVINKLLES